MAAGTPDGYEWALTRVTELEVHLASTMSEAERAQADSASLREIHQDLVTAYKRLQEQHERLRQQLRQEQEERQRLVNEQHEQVNFWRAQLEKSQSSEDTRPTVDAMRLQVRIELEEQYVPQIRVLEDRLACEQRKAVEMQRRAEQTRLDAEQRQQDLKEQAVEQVQAHKVQKDTLERKIADLEAAQQTCQEVAAGRSRIQVQEMEAKIATLQRTLQEQTKHNERERQASMEDIKLRVEEASASRRRVHELQVLLDQEQQRNEGLTAESDVSKRDACKLASQLDDARAQMALLRPAQESEQLQLELTRLQSSSSAEIERCHRAAKTAEDQHQAAVQAQKRAEARIRELEGERHERERDVQVEREELERVRDSDVAAVSLKLERAESEMAASLQLWHDREEHLTRQVETAQIQIDAINKDIAQYKICHDETERKLVDARREHERKEEHTRRECHDAMADMRAELQRQEAEFKCELQHRDAERRAECQQREAELRAEALQRESALQQREAQLRAESQQREFELRTDHQKHEAAAKARLQQQATEHQQQVAKLQAERAMFIAERAKADAAQETTATELTSLHERLAQTQRDRLDQTNAAEAARTELRAKEQALDALQTEFAALSTRIDVERTQWVRETETAHSLALQTEEQRRATAMQQLTEEHARQIAKVQTAAKRTLQKAALKHKEAKDRCNLLAKKVTQLQQERSSAIRICQENKSAYEVHLAQLGLSGGGFRRESALPQTIVQSPREQTADRRELRAIAERLEKNAERVRLREGAAPEA